MTPEELAAQLDPNRLRSEAETAMQKGVLIAERNIKKRSRVRTGTLRRSWTSRVQKAQGNVIGRVGTVIRYARFQKNEPAREGLEDSRAQIEAEFAKAGQRFFEEIR